RRRLQDLAQRVDELYLRLVRSARVLPAQRRARLQTLSARLDARHPAALVRWHRGRHGDLRRRLDATMEQHLSDQRARVSETVRALNTVSPLRTLDRGYAIVTRAADGSLVRASTDVAPGDAVRARLSRGGLDLTVDRRRKS
ncbi:MAG: exodeoxyribonuclease VII large subunit, partial [Gammaproteobacteria bacterium]|nr:exodeoxyribonuclease VII large subunit [Gammaproteobacteria bacterium]